MTVYLNGRFLPKAEARISPDDRGFLFADGVYEVVRVYGGRLFAPERHWKRLGHSLESVRIPLPEGLNWNDLGRELLDRNGLSSTNAVLYLQITRGEAPRRHAFPEPFSPTVYGFAEAKARPIEMQAQGVAAVLLPDIRWHRCDIKSISLLPNVIANQQAHEAGAFEAAFVRDGWVTEGSHANLAAVFDGEIHTHPLNEHILGGITREIALECCHDLGVPVREKAIPEARLAEADEILLFGTTVEVMPVTRLDGKPVGDGTPGKITRRLATTFEEVIKRECG